MAIQVAKTSSGMGFIPERNGAPEPIVAENLLADPPPTSQEEWDVMNAAAQAAGPYAVGVKHDSEKPRTDLLPPDALMAVAEILGYGAKKYSDRNWEKGLTHGRLVGAVLRHLFLYMSGQNVDVESGRPHLAHCATAALMLLAMSLRRPDLDDRPKIDSP